MVIPVFNEADSLITLVKEIQTALNSAGIGYEIIFVNDGSTDNTKNVLNQLAQRHPQAVRVIHHESRQGQTEAMAAGVAASLGKTVVTLDGDLQNDPSDIPVLFNKLQEGYDAVCGWRRDRKDGPLKTLLSKTGNIVQRVFTGLTIHDVSCTLRIYQRDAALKIPLNWEGQHRFIPLCLSLQGFRIGEVVSHHRGRRFGQSKYQHRRVFRVAVDFIRIMCQKGQ